MTKHSFHNPVSVLSLFVLMILLTASNSVLAADEGVLKVGVARVTHGHVWDVIEAGKNGQIQVVGIYEPDPKLADKYAASFGIDRKLIFSDLAEMLDKTSPEVDTAYGSIYEHLGVVQVCAPRGVHVMVEKPLAYSIEQGLAIEYLAKNHGIQVITNYATTWFGSFHAVYDEVKTNRKVGDIRKVVIHDGHMGPREIGCSEEFLAWLTDPVMNGGGALIDFGCYGASLMTWLLDGELPQSVTAVTQQIKPDVYPNVDDEATIVLTYPGAQAIFQASWNWPFDRKDMFVYGRTGYAFAPDSRTLLLRTEGGDEQRKSIDKRQAPYDNAFSYLTAVVRGQIKPGPNDLSSLEANMVVTRILDAARKSAFRGQTVKLQK